MRLKKKSRREAITIQTISRKMNTEAKPKPAMHIAWNALTNSPAGNTPLPETPLDAYHAACAKYSNEIRAIQKYFPGWKPAFGELTDGIEAAI